MVKMRLFLMVIRVVGAAVIRNSANAVPRSAAPLNSTAKDTIKENIEVMETFEQTP